MENKKARKNRAKSRLLLLIASSLLHLWEIALLSPAAAQSGISMTETTEGKEYDSGDEFLEHCPEVRACPRRRRASN